MAITLTLSDFLAILSGVAVIAGAVATYLKITIIREVDALLDEKLDGYTPTSELELRLKNLEYRLGHDARSDS